jgi:uncharacterized protein YdeI (YjbR/CyaY-like superfamily)
MSPKTSRRRASNALVTARFFPSAAAFRRWLEASHARAAEIWLGFHRKAANRRGLTYPEAVDLALCFGWIDGIRKKLDDTTYANRFTPRKPGSIWSLVNIRHVERLTAAGLMHPAGVAAFERRDPARSGIYSFEVRPNTFPEPLEARVRDVPKAWAHFNEQPPGYRRLAIFFVISAKREETQQRRLQQVIDAHERGMRIGVLFGQTGPTPRTAQAARLRSASFGGQARPTPQAPGPRPLSSARRASESKRAKRR